MTSKHIRIDWSLWFSHLQDVTQQRYRDFLDASIQGQHALRSSIRQTTWIWPLLGQPGVLYVHEYEPVIRATVTCIVATEIASSTLSNGLIKIDM